jgi:predicted ArsR family transcriptional regulator
MTATRAEVVAAALSALGDATARELADHAGMAYMNVARTLVTMQHAGDVRCVARRHGRAGGRPLHVYRLVAVSASVGLGAVPAGALQAIERAMRRWWWPAGGAIARGRPSA